MYMAGHQHAKQEQKKSTVTLLGRRATKQEGHLTPDRQFVHPVKEREKVSNKLWREEEDLSEVNKSNVRRKVTIIKEEEMEKVYLN